MMARHQAAARPCIVSKPDSEVVVDDVDGIRSFRSGAGAYDAFMGRYSFALAVPFADAAQVRRGVSALDVGCGTGALTRVLTERLGVDAVAACDPTAAFADECSRRHPGVRVRTGRAESLPFADASFDRVLAQLVLHFVSDPRAAAREMMRVATPNAIVAACVWDFEQGMEMLRRFWDAARRVDPDAPDEATTMRFGRPGEIAELFASAGLMDVSETTLRVSSDYVDFDELWSSLLGGAGPAGAFTVSLDDSGRERLRGALAEELGVGDLPFTLHAVARCAVGHVRGALGPA